MRLKEDLFKWFVRNIVYAKNEIIDKPGFIVCQYTEKGRTTYMREIFYPEAVWVKFEKNLVDKHGKQGIQVLYSAGKKFGYSYTHASNFSRIKEIERKTFENNVYFFLRYIECVWTNRLEHEIDYDRELFKATFDDYVICPKNGMGYIMLAGCVGGWWAYLIDDKNAEGIQTRCIGRGDSECEVLCGHKKDLQGYDGLFTEAELPLLDYDSRYVGINKLQTPSYARTSLKDLMYSKQFIQTGGVLMHGPYRHYVCESSLFYFLESELKKLEGGTQILFDSAFEYGKELAEHQKERVKDKFSQYIMDYMSAVGWGDVLVKFKDGRYEVLSQFFPWTELAESVEFTIFRGMISGMLSGFLDTKIVLGEVRTHWGSGGGFTVLTSQNEN